MSPGIARAKSASIQRPAYVIRLQTVWRLYGDGMETHRFSVPADGDQDDLITLEGWTPRHGSLTLKRQRPTQIQQENTATRPTDIDPPGNGNTNCSSFSWGCSQTINNGSATQITASQICKSNLPGKPSTLGCLNEASTVVVLGQLP